MLTNADQHFLVQLSGYVMGMAGAGIIALYLFYRIFKGAENAISSIFSFLASLPKKKKAA